MCIARKYRRNEVSIRHTLKISVKTQKKAEKIKKKSNPEKVNNTKRWFLNILQA